MFAARVRIYVSHILAKAFIPQLIALESCSNPQITWQVLESAMKKNFLVLGFS